MHVLLTCPVVELFRKDINNKTTSKAANFYSITVAVGSAQKI